MHKKKLSPYMYLIHDNLKKEELVTKYQSFISEKHNQVLGLRGRAKSNYAKKGAAKLPFEPHYNHDHKNRSVGNNQFNMTHDDELEQSSVMNKYNTQQDVTPERGNSLMNDNYAQTVKKVSRSHSGSPGRSTQKGSTKKKTMGTSIRARYEKLRDILEERNEELEKERLTFLGCIQKIKDLRVMYFGESEAYFVDQNENAKHSFDKEYCALELCIQQDLQKQSLVNKSMQDLENKLVQQEKQKNQAVLTELQKEKEGYHVKLLEKEKVIQELHKALKSSDNDVQVLSKEIQQFQTKLREVQQQLTQQQDLNRKMAKRVNELKKIEEYGTTNLLVQQEIENLKSSKNDIERKYYELKHKVGDIQKLKEDNINLKLELDHRVKDLKVENEKISREYQILLKEYKVLKTKCKQQEDDSQKSGANAQVLQETQQKLSTQIQKDLEIEKQYYESKILALRKENEQLQTEVLAVKKQQRDFASVSYSKEEFEKMTTENTKRVKMLEEKVDELTNKNKQLLADQQSLQNLKQDFENLKQLYEQERTQNKEYKQKMQLSEKAYSEYQQQQQIIHENLRLQLNQTQHQIDTIKHQQSVQIQQTNPNDDDNSSNFNKSQVMIIQSNQQKNTNNSRNDEDRMSNYSNNNLVIPQNSKKQQQEDAQSNKSSKNNASLIVTQQQQHQSRNNEDSQSNGRKSITNSNHNNNIVIIPPPQNIKTRSVSQQSHNSRDQNSQKDNFSQKDIVSQKLLNESMVNLSQKSRNPVQFVDEQKSNPALSHKQSVQSNTSAIRNQTNPQNNNPPQEQIIIKTYISTDQTHERRKFRARSQASNYSKESEQRIDEFEQLSDDDQQYSKLEKEDLLAQKKLNQLKQQKNNKNSNNSNNRRSFHTQPDQEVNNDL